MVLASRCRWWMPLFTALIFIPTYLTAQVKSIPGQINAEDFDAFNDSSPPQSGVDLAKLGQNSYIAWFEDNEWVEYRVQGQPGRYKARFRIGSLEAAQNFTLLLDGTPIVGNIPVPQRGTNVKFGEQITGEFSIPDNGEHRLRVRMNPGKSMKFDWMKLEFQGDLGSGGGGTGGGGTGIGGSMPFLCGCKQPSGNYTRIFPAQTLRVNGRAVDHNSFIRSKPNGHKFLFMQGEHRIANTIQPKNNQEFYGETGANCRQLATLSGSRRLTNFSSQNIRVNGVNRTIYVAGGQRQARRKFNGYSGWGSKAPFKPPCQDHDMGNQCRPGRQACEMCLESNDIFFNDEPFTHVFVSGNNKANLFKRRGNGPLFRTFYFDYNADRILLADNPAGKRVEVSTTPYAFASSSTGVKIYNLRVLKFAPPIQEGAVGGGNPGTNWTIQNIETSGNHGSGIRIAQGSRVLCNQVLANGQVGFRAKPRGGGLADGMQVMGNEFAYNNYLAFNPGWEGGGTKFADTVNLEVKYNCAHNNYGMGLWTDINNKNSKIEHNVVFNNHYMGIFHEISHDAVIRHNKAGFNGKANRGNMWDANIQIAGSNKGIVENNHVEVGRRPDGKGFGNGILVVWQKRTRHGKTYHGRDNIVRNNTVIYHGSTGHSGAKSDHSDGNIRNKLIYTTNSFNNNRYFIRSGSSQNRFYWVYGSLMNLASAKNPPLRSPFSQQNRPPRMEKDSPSIRSDIGSVAYSNWNCGLVE